MAVRIDASADFIGRTANLPDPQTSTMSGWAIMDVDRGNFSSICCLTATLRANGQLCLQTDVGGNTFNLWYDSGSIGVNEPSTGYSAAVGVPFFWALVCEGTGSNQVKAYFREYGSKDFNVVFTASTGLGATYTPALMRFGNADTNEFWNGRIQNVKVWDRALTRAELLIESYYRRVMFPSSINLWLPLDLGQDLADYSGNGRTATGGGTLTDGDGVGLWVPQRKVIYIPAASGTQFNKSVDGAVTFSGGLSATAVFLRALTGAVTFAGAISKRTSKSPSGAVTFAGAIAKQTQRSLSGSVSFTGSLAKQTRRALTGAVSFAGNLLESFTTLKVVSGAVSFAGAVVGVIIPFVPGSVVKVWRKVWQTVWRPVQGRSDE